MSLLIRGARLVGSGELVDVRLGDGMITAVAPELEGTGEPQLDADGRWIIPGLWDQHVHFTQWARSRQRVDVSGTADPRAVTMIIEEHVRRLRDVDSMIIGFGFRIAGWGRLPTAEELDSVSGDHPVVLISGDVHAGWLNSAAARSVGVEPGLITEGPWFAVLPEITGGGAERSELDEAMTTASAYGVVGIADFEFTDGWNAWPRWATDGLDRLRVRPAVYPADLDRVLALGLRTGDRLDADGLVTMGPLKIISDGSLNTRTAWCDQPYADDHGGRGGLNYSPEEIRDLLTRATAGGLEVAVHAIGDAAVALALDAFAVTGARGSIEHAQLVRRESLAIMADLHMKASVQPAHLLDDRDVTQRCWPDRADRCFALRSMIDAGVGIALGSDAPVSPLDPWLAMAAAVHRSADERAAWHPEQAITPREALAASTDGQSIMVGARGDVVLLDRDPLTVEPDPAAAARRLREVRIEASIVAGRPVYDLVS